MTQDIPFQCKCRAVCGVLHGVARREAVRFVCHCDDCQTAAIVLGHADRLDARGGTEAAMVKSSALRITAGLDRLAALRVAAIASRPLIRWHCRDCGTPLFSTYDRAQRSFLSVLLANCEPVACDAALGPSSGHVWTKYAKGGRAGLREADLMAIVTRLVWRQIAARMTGDYRETPLFDRDTGRPIVEPRRLSPQERASAKTHA